jgi:hypothetical protein
MVGANYPNEEVREAAKIKRAKHSLQVLYSGGPNRRETKAEADSRSVDTDPTRADDDGESEVTSIPIPPETFLEELSRKLQIHPISVYRLLDELRIEGVRCKAEEQRLLEDRLSVLVLCLLGHRWPKQMEAGETVPDWAESSGIIPLIGAVGQVTVAERMRAWLRVNDGDLWVQQTEALVAELTGLSLEEWLRRQFFSRHIRQFKYRPIAWHLTSRPTARAGGKRGRGGRVQPAFECLIYYHSCGGDLLARLRTRHVEPLL